MNIYVTRHGETDWNKKLISEMEGKQLNGLLATDDDNIELNEKGIEQAKEIKERIKNKKIDLIICSPLIRAKQTARIVNENRNIPIIYDKKISVRKFGEFKGKKANIDFDFNRLLELQSEYKI